MPTSWPLMAVNGGHAGTKKGPNWGHVNRKRVGFETDAAFWLTV